MALLEVTGISKNFGSTHVLQNISLNLEKGEALAIIGSSGSGKTTLLRALMPSLCPDAPMLLTAAVPGRWVEMRDTAAGAAAVIGRFDAALPPGENRMRPVADGLLLLGVPALHRMAACLLYTSPSPRD